MHRRSITAKWSFNGKQQTLCGHYLMPYRLTDDPSLVDCKICLRATTSARTIAQGRVAS